MSPLTLEFQNQGFGPIGISRANKQDFITKNTEILEKRTKELVALQINGNVDEVTAKRIERLKQIVMNLQQSIEKAKAEICLGRPYGM